MLAAVQSDVEFNYQLRSATDYPMFATRAIVAARTLDGLLQTADVSLAWLCIKP